MGRGSSLSNPTSTPIVEDKIGEAYEIVKTVSEHLDEIATVAAHIDEIPNLSEILPDLQGYSESAQTAATDAAAARDAAIVAKDTAVTAQGTATTKAGEATTSAATASTKASEAAASATAAAGSVSTVNTAKDAAEAAATTASTAADTATTKASDAAGSATTATTKASEASSSATAAAASATAAAQSESNAADDASDAAMSANAAETYKNEASDSADAAAASALEAANIAGGGVTSWNTRSGAVTSQAGDYDADDITETLTNKIMTAAERTKLAGVAAGATANATDAALRDRSTHTGSQAISTVTGLQSALDAKAAASSLGTAASLDTGTTSGTIPVLDGSGLIPSALLPSYVDDVLEYANQAAFPGTGETGKIYVALDSNKTYRWSGSAYVEISASPGSTDAVTEGSTNLYFTAARVLATVLTGLSMATNAAITTADSVLSALGKLQKQITDHLANTSNPHSVTKSQVGLGNADNTSDVNKPISTLTQTALDAKAGTSTATTGANGLMSSSDKTKLNAVGTMANRAVTISSSAPSGGSDGDVWFQI